MNDRPPMIHCTIGCCPGCQSCYGMSIGCHQDPCRCDLPCTCDYFREETDPGWRAGCERHDSLGDLRQLRSWHEADDSVLPLIDGDPCPECGERYACGYDAEGRPMVHVLMLDMDESLAEDLRRARGEL